MDDISAGNRHEARAAGGVGTREIRLPRSVRGEPERGATVDAAGAAGRGGGRELGTPIAQASVLRPWPSAAH